MMGVGLGASGHTPTMENHSSSAAATPSMPGIPTIKEEAETSADSLTIDVEGNEGHEDSTISKLKAENDDPIESKAWINALRTHVVVPLIRHPKSLPFRKPVDPIALGIFPVYNQIVTHPMDLGTIKSRIDDNLYGNKVDLIADIQLVWNNAKKFNPKTHAVYEAAEFLEKFSHERIDKIKRDGPHSISRPIAPLPPPRESSKRDARKKSLDLPGETHLPQHLEQNRSASGSMRACENLLRNLMTQKMHREYVEPFIEVHRKGDSEIYDPMSLSKIQNRLRSNSYHHPLEFAADMRRIVTETYRYTAPKDPLIELAGKLQSEFEMMFAKIDFQEDEIIPPIYSGLSEDDRFISKLLTAQNVMVNIQTELTSLIQDYIIIKKKDQKRKEKKSLVSLPMTTTPVAPSSGSAVSSASSKFKPQSQKRKLPTSLPKPKKPKIEKQQAKPVLQQGMLKTRKNNLTLEEGNRLKQQIANLSPAQQMTVLEILRENKEKLDQDEEGNVEMEFRDFTQKSINDLQAYVNSVTNPSNSSSTATKNPNADSEDSNSDSDDSSSSSDSDSDSD